MIIYFLRHEEREGDSRFHGKLTEQGYENAKTKTISNLESIEFSSIYCSPFIRCMETIKPYCEKYNKQVIVDYKLSEYCDSNYSHYIDDVPDEYKSIINHIDNSYNIQIPEDEMTLHNRSLNFLVSRLFLSEPGERNKNILVVSHLFPIMHIVGIYTGKMVEIKMGEIHAINVPIDDNIYLVN